MLLDLNRYSPAVFRKEASKLGALAVPMLLAQIAQVGLAKLIWLPWHWAAAHSLLFT